MNFQREEKYKEKITELQRTIRFLSNSIADAIQQLEKRKTEYTILLLNEILNDKRFVRK